MIDLKQKIIKICKISLLGAIVVIIAGWILQVGFKNAGLKFRLARLSAGASKEKEDSVTRATPKVDREAMFYKKLDKNYVRCELCFKKCIIADGRRGFCRARENREGTLYSLVYSKPSAVQIDPIEKEPHYHMLPGTRIFCLGTAGCNFNCQHCHNWQLSQATPGETSAYFLPPEKVIEFAKEEKIPTISFTYNEPTVCFEYLYDVAVLAKKNGLRILWHSNGYINPEPLKKLLKYTDAVTIDLKGFSAKAYRNSLAELEPVLETLKTIRKKGVLLEIVNLIIPTINDDTENIARMCRWIKTTLGAEVPLHFSRFVPAYKLASLPQTPLKTLEEAYNTAREAGLHYVSIGNIPGHKYNSTFCPECGKRLIHRVHFKVLKNNIKKGKCRFCGHRIPGIWD